MGMLSTITFFPVSAHRVEVTALSMPPEIPTTKPVVLELLLYSFSQPTMCSTTPLRSIDINGILLVKLGFSGEPDRRRSLNLDVDLREQQYGKNSQILAKYIPEGAVPLMARWIVDYDFKLKITRERNSRLGDY